MGKPIYLLYILLAEIEQIEFFTRQIVSTENKVVHSDNGNAFLQDSYNDMPFT